ncbi:MAG: hypothetical protein KGI37_02810 [Alphaproteobacteria bacterium]|nr:hypothetical protein [Alphaproteobacteria bacterium]
MIECRLAASKAPVTIEPPPSELRRVVQILRDTYETLDLRIETTLAAAGNDFLAAMPEIETHREEMRQFIISLIDNLRPQIDGTLSQPILLYLAFHDEYDLAQPFPSHAQNKGSAQ